MNRQGFGSELVSGAIKIINSMTNTTQPVYEDYESVEMQLDSETSPGDFKDHFRTYERFKRMFVTSDSNESSTLEQMVSGVVEATTPVLGFNGSGIAKAPTPPPDISEGEKLILTFLLLGTLALLFVIANYVEEIIDIVNNMPNTVEPEPSNPPEINAPRREPLGIINEGFEGDEQSSQAVETVDTRTRKNENSAAQVWPGLYDFEDVDAIEERLELANKNRDESLTRYWPGIYDREPKDSFECNASFPPPKPRNARLFLSLSALKKWSFLKKNHPNRDVEIVAAFHKRDEEALVEFPNFYQIIDENVRYPPPDPKQQGHRDGTLEKARAGSATVKNQMTVEAITHI